MLPTAITEGVIHAVESAGRRGRRAFIGLVDRGEPLIVNRSNNRLGEPLPQHVVDIIKRSNEPVVNIGGWTSTGRYLDDHLRSFELDGFPAMRFDPYANGLVNIDKNVTRLADQLVGYANDPTISQVNLVGHSEGGIIAVRFSQLQDYFSKLKALDGNQRAEALAQIADESPEFATYLARELGKSAVKSALDLKVVDIVTIGSPFDGVGRLPAWDGPLGDAIRGNRIVRAFVGDAGLQMTKGSPFLKTLKAHRLPEGTHLTTTEGKADLLVPFGRASHPESTHIVLRGNGGMIDDIIQSNHLLQIRHPDAYEATRWRLMPEEARAAMGADAQARFERMIDRRPLART